MRDERLGARRAHGMGLGRLGLILKPVDDFLPVNSRRRRGSGAPRFIFNDSAPNVPDEFVATRSQC